MKTLTVKPIPGALDDVPKEHLQKWFDALQTSVKHTEEMCNIEDTAHCCLCVSARLEGATFDDYGEHSEVEYFAEDDVTVNGCYAPITHDLQQIRIATFKGNRHFFANLNDGTDGLPRDLTHPEIAEIIMGREVVLEVAG